MGKRKDVNMNEDLNGNAISTWTSFQTDCYTILADDTFEPIAVPSAAAEVVLEPIGDFTYGESLTAIGNTKREIQLGVLGMQIIYVKGSLGQKIELTWGLI